MLKDIRVKKTGSRDAKMSPVESQTNRMLPQQYLPQNPFNSTNHQIAA